MSHWPSKDPDDYVRRASSEANSGARSEPPYLLWLLLSLAGAGLIVLGAAIVGALRPSAWIWLLIAGVWVSRSQIERWWQDTHAVRLVSWRPAAAFAVTALLVGFAATTLVDGRMDRSKVLYVALLVAWFGGDALDWSLRRRRVPRTAVV